MGADSTCTDATVRVEIFQLEVKCTLPQGLMTLRQRRIKEKRWVAGGKSEEEVKIWRVQSGAELPRQTVLELIREIKHEAPVSTNHTSVGN